jgi:hypothetical protein
LGVGNLSVSDRAAAHPHRIFQSLQTGVGDSVQPIVAPIADYQWVSEPGALGSRLALDGNFMNLSRLSGIDTRRVSVGSEWRAPCRRLRAQGPSAGRMRQRRARSSTARAATSSRGKVASVVGQPFAS